MRAIERKCRVRFCRLEIAGLVKDIVRGQKHLVLFEDHPPAGDERGGIGCRLARVVSSAADITDDGRNRELFGERGKLAAIAIQKSRAFNEVLRQVAAQAQLGENRKLRTPPLSLLSEIPNAAGIAGEITDYRIHLLQTDFHARRNRIRSPRKDCEFIRRRIVVLVSPRYPAATDKSNLRCLSGYRESCT